MKIASSSQNVLPQIKLKQRKYVSICSRIAILSSYNKYYPYFFDASLLLIEYVQLIAQIFIISYELSNDSSSNTINLCKPILVLAKILNPAYLSGSEQNSFLIGISIFLMCYCFIKYGLFLFIVTLAIKKKKEKSFFARLWTWIFKIQGRFSYFLITSFWLKTIQSLVEDNTLFEKSNNLPIIIACIVATILEFIFSFYLQVHFTFVLPTENFLATANYKTELITLSQKFFTQIIQLLLLNSEVNRTIIVWIFSAINTVISLLRDRCFFSTLPLFDLKALLWQLYLVITVTSLSLAFSLNTIIEAISQKEIPSNFIIIVWLVLAIFMVKLGNASVKKIQLNLIKQLYDGSAEYLIHKITIVKTLLEQSPLLNEFKKKYAWECLLNSTLMAKIHKGLNIHLSPLTNQLNNFNKTKEIKKILLAYLEKLLTKFPKNDHLKLYLGFYYLKIFKLYGLGMKILIELKQSHHYQTSLNALLIINETKNDIKRKHQTDNAPLNILRYIKCADFMTKLKNKMAQQAEVSIKLYQEINKSSPNLLKIFLSGQKIYELKCSVEKKIRLLSEIIPEHYIEPLMLCSQYYLTLNHSLEEYLKYKNAFIWKHQKYEKKFNTGMLCEENLYQEINSLTLISGDKGNEGIIINCAKSFNELFGRILVGSHFSSLAIPFIQKEPHDELDMMLRNADRQLINKVRFYFGYNSQGYMMPLSYYITICPYLDQGLYYFFVHRPIATNKEYIMISEKGLIEGFTRQIGEKLGLLSGARSSLLSEINIGLICKELENVNRALNMIAFPEKEKLESLNIEITIPTEINKTISAVGGATKDFQIPSNKMYPSQTKAPRYDQNSNINIDDAQNLISIFTLEGKNVDFICLKPEEQFSSRNNVFQTFTYHCKVEDKPYKQYNLRLITLQEVLSKNNQQRDRKLTSYEEIKSPLMKNKKLMFKEMKEAFPTNIVLHQVEHENDTQTRENAKMDSPTRRSRHVINNATQIAENDIIPSSQRIFLKKDPSVPSPTDFQVTFRTQQVIEERQEAKENNFIAKPNDEESQKSRQPKTVKISKVFKNAIETKYYPYLYKIFTGLLYIIFMIIISNQIMIRLNISSDATNLEARKNFLRIAESRNGFLITHHRRTRHLWNYATGLQNEKDYIATASSLSFISVLANDLQQLINANKGLLNATNYLEDDSRAKLFQQDVRVYENYFNQPQESFINLTNFQAIARIIETSSAGLTVARKNLSQAVPYFNIVLRNSLNDLLLRSEYVADIFQKSLDNQKSATLDFITINLIIILIITIMILPIFGIISFVQYQNERKNLHAFVKVDPAGIIHVLEKITSFKAMIQDEAGFQDIKDIDLLKYYSYSRRTESHVKILKARSSQSPKDKELARGYWFYNLKLFTLVLIIIALIISNFNTTRQLINSATKILTQIHFADRMKSRLDLTVATAMELVSENGTTLIENYKTSREMDLRINDLLQLRNIITDMFRNEDSTYDPLVEDILFGNACSYLTGIYVQFCETFRKGAQNSGLIRLMSDLEATLKEFDTKFHNSRKSSTALKSLILEAYNNIITPEVSLTILVNFTSKNFNDAFTDLLQKKQPESTLYTYIICFSSCFICLFIHFGIVNKMKENENQFKRLLDTLPANIVLVNFVLKSYLIKTSKTAFDSIRNEI